MSRDKVLFGMGAACVVGCAAAPLAPLVLSAAIVGWKLGVVGALLLLAGAFAVGVARRRTQAAPACRVDASCGCQAAQADAE